MQYHFSDRISTLKPSAIREIFKYAADPAVVSLSAGNPAPDAFAKEQIGEIVRDIFATRPIDALQYSVTEGYPQLRAFIRDYMLSRHNVGRDFDDVLVTSGAQQIMELSAKVLCNEGDVVICEDPSFIGSLNCFRSLGAKLKGVPVDPDGMNMEKLAEVLKDTPSARFIYTIPNFQNPSGITMSLEKRRTMYALAKQYGVLIVEDNPYGDLRYSGENLPNIKSFDEEGLVIYSGSYSKVIAPGLRVGYCVAPAEIIKKMVVGKQGEDVHTNILAQMICYEFMTRYDFDENLANLRALYRRKAQFAMELLDRYVVPHGITYHPIEGGLFIWCTLPESVDMADFCKRAVADYKVAIVPGNAFLCDEKGTSHCFRINFSTPSDEKLEEGIKRLGTFAATVLNA
ncbi:MAG: PLP-dependent aminotransferase family protein [Clostridia bacterium]|nr:PLP-dependent aminotransferase family protein [Clostridia bacterium]